MWRTTSGRPQEWDRAERPDPIAVARALRSVLDQIGLDENGPEVRRLKRLTEAGRPDIALTIARSYRGRAARRILARAVFPLRREPCVGEVELGDSIDGLESGALLRLNLVSQPRHVAVFGRTGRGKSHLVKLMILQAIKAGARAWYFDIEGESSDLLGAIPRDQLWHLRVPSDMRGNLLAPEGEFENDIRGYANRIAGVLRSIFFGRDGSDRLLLHAILVAYRIRGCFQGSRNWPTLRDVLVILENMRADPSSRLGGWRETALRIVRRVIDDHGDSLCARAAFPTAGLATKNVCFDVSSLGRQALTLFIAAMLEKSGDPRRAGPPRIAVIEEAHLVLNQSLAGREDLGEPPLQESIRRARKRNLSIWLVDQCPSQMPTSVTANVGTTIALPMRHSRDVFAVSSAIGLRRDQMQALASLPLRTAIVSSDELGPAALMFRIPERPLEHADPAVVRAEMDEILRTCPFTRDAIAASERDQEPRSQNAGQSNTPTASSESAASDALTASERRPPARRPAPRMPMREAPSGTEGRVLPDLAPHLEDLLWRIGRFPEETISSRAAVLKIVPNVESTWRAPLVRGGLVSEVLTISRLRFFGATPLGEAYLRERGVMVPKTKGGLGHYIAERLIEADIKERAGSVVLERNRATASGAQPDLLVRLAPGAERIAIQISDQNSANYETQAVLQLAHDPGIDGVVVLALDKAKAHSIHEQLESARQREREHGCDAEPPDPELDQELGKEAEAPIWVGEVGAVLTPRHPRFDWNEILDQFRERAQARRAASGGRGQAGQGADSDVNPAQGAEEEPGHRAEEGGAR